MTTTVTLSSGKTTVVDQEDYALVSRYRWHEDHGYASANVPVLPEGARTVGQRPHYKKVYMHRLIMATPPGLVTDHVNRNKLDNRKVNLRVCTNADNARNRTGVTGSRSKFKGVHGVTGSPRWAASITVSGASIHLGVYDTEEDAAVAYNAAARVYFGSFARLNEVTP